MVGCNATHQKHDGNSIKSTYWSSWKGVVMFVETTTGAAQAGMDLADRSATCFVMAGQHHVL